MYGIQVNGQVVAQFAAPLHVKNVVPVYLTDTMSLSRRVSRRAVQRWEIQSNVVPLSSDANAFFVDLVIKGKYSEVDVVMPQNYGVISKRTNTATPVATGSAGASQVTISGVNGLIPKGTFVRFSNHSKVYMTTSDISAPGPLDIFPELRSAVSGTNMYCKDDVIMTAYYDGETVSGMLYSDGILMDPGSVLLVEKV